MEQQIFPVDMICLCNANGDIQPLRFRMEDEKHQLVRVDIDEVVSCKKIQYVGIEAYIFLCSAMVGDSKWLIELKYTIRSHIWSFHRKVY